MTLEECKMADQLEEIFNVEMDYADGTGMDYETETDKASVVDWISNYQPCRVEYLKEEKIGEHTLLTTVRITKIN